MKLFIFVMWFTAPSGVSWHDIPTQPVIYPNELNTERCERMKAAWKASSPYAKGVCLPL